MVASCEGHTVADPGGGEGAGVFYNIGSRSVTVIITVVSRAFTDATGKQMALCKLDP